MEDLIRAEQRATALALARAGRPSMTITLDRLCARTVVINSALAGCFLHRFPEWQFKASAAIVVDLSSCKDDKTGRGVIAALPAPGAPSAEPDKEFIVTLAQLVCLKRKLEDPALVLDPSATIDLGACE